MNTNPNSPLQNAFNNEKKEEKRFEIEKKEKVFNNEKKEGKGFWKDVFKPLIEYPEKHPHLLYYDQDLIFIDDKFPKAKIHKLGKFLFYPFSNFF